jgi:lipopolysaccharide assembly outer membrane protein LptD (OstA)
LRVVFPVVSVVACLALAQNIQVPERKQIPASGGAWANVQVAASSIERGAHYPAVIRLKGNVEIKMKGLKVFADEADFDEVNGEIEARGRVRVVPYPAVDAFTHSH